MNVELIMITNKPAEEEWWWVLNPDKMAKIDDYVTAYPGYVSYVKEMIGNDTRVQTITFQSDVDLTNWIPEMYTNCPEALERRWYNDEHGMVTNINV